MYLIVRKADAEENASPSAIVSATYESPYMIFKSVHYPQRLCSGYKLSNGD